MSASKTTPGPARRKGAIRMSAIPPGVLRDLNAGREETITLVEWLAIDIRKLARAILPQVGLADRGREILAAAERLARQGVTRRTSGMGEAILLATLGDPRRDSILEALACHRSDMVRSWAAYASTGGDGHSLSTRLEAARCFAADGNPAVRECVWETFRPQVAADLRHGLELLRSWVRDPDPNVRRCAVEATRPRGVWARHIEPLKSDPAPAEVILEPVRSDPSRYVQRAVANWINDAGKSRPDWARSICARWTKESPTPATAWIVNHALRTLRKSEGGARRRASQSAAAPSRKGRPLS